MLAFGDNLMKNIGAIAVLTKILAFNVQYERWIDELKFAEQKQCLW